MNCYCNSEKPFTRCCEPLITTTAQAKTPVQLMRSRFTAYKLGGYGEYLLKTWFPLMTKGLTVADLSQKTREWQQLEVLSKSQQGDDGLVEFKATFIDELGKEQVHHEYSIFKRIKGAWLYVGEEIRSNR